MLPAEITDGLKLLSERLDEAVTDRTAQRNAVEKAAKAGALIRQYIKANDMRIAIAMLVCEQLTFDDDWWEAFAHYDRERFLETAYWIRKGLDGLESGLATAEIA